MMTVIEVSTICWQGTEMMYYKGVVRKSAIDSPSRQALIL
jgi:hypothetical protein